MNEQPEALSVLRSQSLASAVQEEIERRILSGAIAAGARVNENGLATELGVSRGPIREACRGLVEMGLLTTVVNRGFFVREVTAKDAIDVYDVRASLMRLAGETLAARITDAQLAVLETLVAEMDQAESGGDFDAFYALNREFHDRIVDFAENDRLRALCDGLVKELHLYRRRSLLQGGGLAVSNTEHRDILDTLRSRDPAAAGAALERHIQAGKARFLTASAETSDQGEAS
ncbi:MAG: FCD domain-containing protein [Rhodospirillaceae bacterium]|nr:FCD domain-containing protein [Rhodospirillaceae bacterium]MDD9915034.1 FCD domain-containing protein [Rhodospirillaceae bacterium]MDD9928043.1 FCD domain-containing protein [Rhodospirillaceae bacterium]